MVSDVIDIPYPHWFKPAFDTDKRYIDIWGGRGRGGSHTGTNYFLDLITSPEYFRGYFVRQAFNDIRGSLFQDFKDRISENPTIDERDFRIQENEMRILYVPTGNMIISKGVKKDGNRTAKMKSLAGATHVLMEEADEVGEEDFDQMDDSLRTIKVKNVQVIRIFNPPHKQHWIWRDYNLSDSSVPGYFAAFARTDRNVLSLFATHRSNLVNMADSTIEKFRGYKSNKPEYYYTVICGLISEGQKGRIYSGWESITNDFFNSVDARSIFGLDFGENTGGLVEVKTVNSNAYVRQLYYGGGSAKELAMLFCTLGIKDELIIADSADPTKISKLRWGWDDTELLPWEIEKYPQMLNGWNIVGVSKPKGSIIAGIGIVKDHKVFLTEDSVNFWDEYRDYKWALDKNKNPTDEPEDSANHCFPSGTMIRTIDGEKPIEKIAVGDMVLTRCGYFPITRCGFTGIKEIFSYKITCGINDYLLNCTNNHKINIGTKWIQSQYLPGKRKLWLYNTSTIQNTDCIKEKNTLALEGEECIGMFGSSIMGKYLMDFTFIISIIILTIMTFLTWIWLVAFRIYLNMQKKIRPQTKILYWKGLKGSGHLQKNGMDRPPVLNNTESRLSKPDLDTLTYRKYHAAYAASILNLKTILQYFAQITARVNTEEILELTISKRHAKFANQNLPLINTQEQKHALRNAEVYPGQSLGKMKTYNIEVDGTHEYYANGILVSNCHDPFRYVLYSKGRLF